MAKYEVRAERLGYRLGGRFSQEGLAALEQMYLSRRFVTSYDIRMETTRRLLLLAHELAIELGQSMRDTAIQASRDEANSLIAVMPIQFWAHFLGIALPGRVLTWRYMEAQGDEDKPPDIPEFSISIAAPWISPAEITYDEYETAIRRLIFPPLTEAKLNEILNHAWAQTGDGWKERILRHVGQEAASSAINAIVESQAKGERWEVLRNKLIPILGGSEPKARELARRGVMWAANQGSKDAWQHVDDAIVGEMVIAILDDRTRPHHATRSGRVYWKSQYAPKGNQWRWEDRPRLPDEPWCRCTSIAVFNTPDNISKDDVKQLETEAGAIPDPTSMTEWWDQADEEERIAHVGLRRYAAMKERLGKNTPVRYSHFIDPDSGKIVKMAQIKDETQEQFAERTRRVAALIGHRAQQYRQMTKLGFIPRKHAEPKTKEPNKPKQDPPGQSKTS